MRGRSLDIEVFPLSFAEFIRFNGLMKELPHAPYSSRAAGALRHAMTRYFEEGGFPDVQGADYRVRVKMLQGNVDAVLCRDVIERHVVTWDSEGETDGIRIVPVWKWCLEINTSSCDRVVAALE